MPVASQHIRPNLIVVYQSSLFLIRLLAPIHASAYIFNDMDKIKLTWQIRSLNMHGISMPSLAITREYVPVTVLFQVTWCPWIGALCRVSQITCGIDITTIPFCCSTITCATCITDTPSCKVCTTNKRYITQLLNFQVKLCFDDTVFGHKQTLKWMHVKKRVASHAWCGKPRGRCFWFASHSPMTTAMSTARTISLHHTHSPVHRSATLVLYSEHHVNRPS
jgi:hypothetical protein